jgi:hypothetical protein
VENSTPSNKQTTCIPRTHGFAHGEELVACCVSRLTDITQFSLFTADVLQAIGSVMSIKWVHEGKVEVGKFCNAQGQLGLTYCRFLLR